METSAFSTPTPIRHLPRYQLVARLKQRGVRQWDIARAAGASTGYVNQVLSRQVKDTPLVEKIWQAVEAALA